MKEEQISCLSLLFQNQIKGLVGFHEKIFLSDLHCAADWQYTIDQREMCCFYMQQAAEMSLTSVLAQENGRGPRNSS